MAAELQLVLLEPRDVEFLARCAALELSGDIFLVVTDDPVKALKLGSRALAVIPAGDMLTL